mmetsp:Transcript_41043/g.64852  ORF Transcript_41043/g.64852 Transcript_41043/m.64852 type:complete len:347 (-) Transcript_41043:810-1850(-)
MSTRPYLSLSLDRTHVLIRCCKGVATTTAACGHQTLSTRSIGAAHVADPGHREIRQDHTPLSPSGRNMHICKPDGSDGVDIDRAQLRLGPAGHGRGCRRLWPCRWSFPGHRRCLLILIHFSVATASAFPWHLRPRRPRQRPLLRGGGRSCCRARYRTTHGWPWRHGLRLVFGLVSSTRLLDLLPSDLHIQAPRRHFCDVGCVDRKNLGPRTIGADLLKAKPLAHLDIAGQPLCCQCRLRHVEAGGWDGAIRDHQPQARQQLHLQHLHDEIPLRRALQEIPQHHQILGHGFLREPLLDPDLQLPRTRAIRWNQGVRLTLDAPVRHVNVILCRIRLQQFFRTRKGQHA